MMIITMITIVVKSLLYNEDDDEQEEEDKEKVKIMLFCRLRNVPATSQSHARDGSA